MLVTVGVYFPFEAKRRNNGRNGLPGTKADSRNIRDCITPLSDVKCEFQMNSAIGIKQLLYGFIKLNREACNHCVPYLPQAELDVFDLYERTVGRIMNQRTGVTVLDVGGGKRCPFAKYKVPEHKTRIVCVDVSMEEMQDNTEVDEKRLGDATRGLPCADAEVDLIVSRSVLEHLKNTLLFIKESARALKDDGYFVHLLPCKFAPFAILNRILPARLSKFLLDLIFPDKKGTLGFRAYYDHCYPRALLALLDGCGFEVQDLVLSYNSSDYFDFFLPAYLLGVLYEVVACKLKIKILCSYILIVAKKTTKQLETSG